MSEVTEKPETLVHISNGVWGVNDEEGNQIGKVSGGKGYYKAIIPDGRIVGEAETKQVAAKIVVSFSAGFVEGVASTQAEIAK